MIVRIVVLVFFNESESTAFECHFEEPALFTNEKWKEDQTTTFADNYFEEIEIPEEEIEMTSDEGEDPLVKAAEKPLYSGARLTLGISMLLIVTFAVRHGLSGVALSDLLTLIWARLPAAVRERSLRTSPELTAGLVDLSIVNFDQ